MSVAQYQMPSAVAAGTAWGANPNMQAPNMSQASSASNGKVLSPVVESIQSSDSRGDRSGDVCLTFDLFGSSESLVAAQWSEETCECTTIVHNSTQIVSCSKEGKELLLTSDLTTKELYQSEEISVGKATTTHVCKLHPMSDVRNAISVERSPYVEVDQSGKVQLAGLASLAVAHAMYLHQSSQPKGDGDDKPKKGKSGKKGRKKQQSVTLISPVAFNQTQRAVLISAANQADLVVRNVFNRAVSTVAGSLYAASRTAGAGDFIGALATPGADEEGALVLYLSVTNLSSHPESEVYEAALVRCEGSKGAQQVGAKLGFERLCTVASASGALLPSKTGGDASTAAQLRAIVEQLCTASGAISKVS